MTHLRRHSFEPATLTSEGIARRDRLLRELHGAMDRRVARRHALRTGAGVVFVVALAAGVMSILWASRPLAPTVSPAPRIAAGGARSTPLPAPVDPAPAGSPAIVPAVVAPPPGVVEIVATDPRIVERLALAVRSDSIEIISDRALQSELALAGVDPGLVTIDGRTLITLASGKPPADPRP